MMLLSLLNVAVAAASLQRSLPTLIASTRVSRGYLIEDRNVLIRRIESSVECIPHVPRVLKDAIKSGMIGAYDISCTLRAWRISFGKLWSLQLQRKVVTHALLKSLKKTLAHIQIELPRLLDAIISSHRALPNWDNELEDRIRVKLKALPARLDKLRITAEALAYSLTAANVDAVSTVRPHEIPEHILGLLADHVQTLVSQTQLIMRPSELFEFSRYIRKVSEEGLRNNFVIWRIHQKTFIESLFAISDPCFKFKGDLLPRALVVEQSTSGMKSLTAHLCFPAADLSIDSLEFALENDDIARIAEMDKASDKVTLELSATIKEISAVGRRVFGGKGGRADFSNLTTLGKQSIKLSKIQEKLFSDARRIRHDYVASACSTA